MNLLSRISAFIKITRPINVLITFCVIIVASIICIRGEYEISKILFAAIVGGTTAGAGNIINDIFDLEIDKINKPARPLAAGRLKLNEALGLYIALVIFSVALSALINWPAFVIEVVTCIALFFYSFSLKKVALFGNLLISFLTGLAFIFGGVAVGHFQYAIIPAIFAFLINLLRELVKDMEDLKGDSQKGVLTFPYIYGPLSTKRLIFVLTFVLMLATFYPFLFNIYGIKYFIVVMMFVNTSLIYFIKKLFDDDSLKNLSRLSFLLKLNMVFGLIAIYLGN
jgi:geranylgeranylglycerol-phosphate geranylgeranyltransferase